MARHPEGGYFIEIHRSGSTPMTTKGQTDFDVSTNFTKPSSSETQFKTPTNSAYESLTLASGRENRRPDHDIRRNCLTSIIWMPLLSTPVLPLGVNCSDHVHYYQGGNPFEYIIYNPETGELYKEILGPAITEGQKLQLPVRGGLWKCGRMLKTDESVDFSLVGEAVAPGFDFHDFSWVTKSEIMSVENSDFQTILLPYLHEDIDQLSGKEVTDAERYYVQ